MNIFVLLKQTFDTEERIVIQNGEISDDGVKYVINPYDEYAVEEALLQRDQHGGTVTVVGVGPNGRPRRCERRWRWERTRRY